MKSPLFLNENEISAIYDRQINVVYRVCYLYMRQHSMDLEDAVQTTFLKLIQSDKLFENYEHEKAWLIVTASNICKNILKHWSKLNIEFNEEIESKFCSNYERDETLDTIMTLPDKYKIPIYLFYYEGYSGIEIAKLLQKKESTIWGYLHRGRKILANILKEEI